MTTIKPSTIQATWDERAGCSAGAQVGSTGLRDLSK
jgi:hypothetical protein